MKWQFFSLLLAATFVSQTAVAQHQDGSIAQINLRRQFDPRKCKIDAGDYVYESLGDTVFKFKSGPIPTLNNPLSSGALRDAPDPADEAGCLGNPLQQRSIDAFYTKFIQVRLFWNFGKMPPSYSGTADWMGEVTNVLQLEHLCKITTKTVVLANGLKGCFLPDLVSGDVPIDVPEASYVSDPSSYSTPLGRPFIVACNGRLRGEMGNACNVTYSYKTDMGLRVSFDGEHSLSVNDVIEADRKLRINIEAATVKNFKWPTPIRIPPQWLQ